jgi:hypothetical protein
LQAAQEVNLGIFKLSLNGTKLADAQLEKLTEQLTNLEILDLFRCMKLQKIKLINCQRLKVLNLGWLQITDVQLE